jgi:glycosyltransferase involved in cell wall biosynthesis
MTASLEGEFAMVTFKQPFISVIIPVYNDSDLLRLCLTALGQQTYPRDYHEVIVIDNNSEEDIAAVAAQFPWVKLLHEPRPGSYVARNKGLSVAQGEVIAFTDADCIPAPTWLENGVRTLLSASDIGLVAGHIELFAQDRDRPNPYELYEITALSFPQDQFLANDHFGVTANLFTFRAVIERVGLFDETLKSGGDKQWGQRVYAAGYRQLYGADAIVNHPARNTWKDLRKRSIRIMGGKYDLLKATQNSRLALLKDFVVFLKPPFRFFWRTWQDARLQGLGQKCQFTWVMLRLRWVAIQERFRLQFSNGVSERS